VPLAVPQSLVVFVVLAVAQSPMLLLDLNTTQVVVGRASYQQVLLRVTRWGCCSLDGSGGGSRRSCNLFLEKRCFQVWITDRQEERRNTERGEKNIAKASVCDDSCSSPRGIDDCRCLVRSWDETHQ
jgi:hypothetical protein